MITYYARLAWLSISRTPIMSALMVLTIAIGIGAYMTTFSLLYMMSSNPMAHKDDKLYAVQLDNWNLGEAYDRGLEDNDMPLQVTHRDATALLQVDIPTRQVAMFRYGLAVSPKKTGVRPFVASVRVTTGDFFSMFDVPFLFGKVWTSEQDNSPAFVTVIDRKTNDILFGGKNSVGETIDLGGHSYTVVGVLDTWKLPIKVYDLNNGSFINPEEIFIPFSLVTTLEPQTWGNNNSPTGPSIESYQDYLLSESVWLQYWVELPDAKAREEYTRFLEHYIRAQKSRGRFQRPPKWVLNKPSAWLRINEVVSQDNRVLVWLSFAFLLVCIVNTVALMLAKFVRKAAEAGVRRALGASQSAIFSQHLIESGVIGVLGALLGISLSLLGLRWLQAIFEGRIDSVAHMDFFMLVTAAVLAIVAAVLAGLYPAWRIGHTDPAFYLKTQ